MKKHLPTILLVLVAIAIGAWLWMDRGSVTQDEKKKRDNDVFVVWRREELLRLVISHEGETITLVRDAAKDSTWRMKSPRDERTDVAAVERLMTTLEFATVQRKVDTTTGLGFENPRASGEVQMGGIVTKFVLGGASPRPEGSSYMKIDELAPIVVSKELAQALLAPSDTYRDRTVVPYLSLDLAKLELRHDSGAVALERADERAFKVAERGVLASRNAMDRIWTALADMRAETFPNDGDADRLTASPRLTIVMTPKDGSKPPAELVVGEACPGHPNDVVVLRKKPTRVAACAPKGALEAMLVVPDTLVDKGLFTPKFDEMEELRLERLGDGDAGAAGAPKAIELARRGTTFHLREPQDRDLDPAEADAVTELLGRLTDAQATSVTPGKGAPFTAIARAKVRFGGDREEVVEVGALDGQGGAEVRRVHDDARLVVGPEIVRRLLPRATSFRKRRIFEEDDRRVSKLVLRCGQPQELVDDGSGFKMIEPKGYEASGRVRQVVEALTRGKIDAWVADEDDGSFGFGSEGCRAIVAFADGKAPATISFGKEGERGVYARVDTRPGVFVAPKSLHKWMSDVHVSEAALRTEFEKIERVRVTLKGKPVTLEQPLMKEAMGRLFATPIAFGRASVTALPPADLVIEVFAEGGPPKRIACRPPENPTDRVPRRKCTKDGLDVVFELPQANFANLLPPEELAPRDAGVD